MSLPTLLLIVVVSTLSVSYSERLTVPTSSGAPVCAPTDEASETHREDE